MRVIDRIVLAGMRLGIGNRSTALLETLGRKSGKPRVTPVTNGLDGDVFWLVTERGPGADYVRNIKAEPRVRVKAGRRWREGIAQIVDEDPMRRLDEIVKANPHARANAEIVRKTQAEHLVVRVDLTPDS